MATTRPELWDSLLTVEQSPNPWELESRSLRFWLNVQMGRFAQFKYLAPAVHSFIFLVMWACYADVNQSLTKYLSSVVGAILMIVDLPFSIAAFGVMFGGGRNETIALIAWGIGCTLWWHLLGRGIDALRRRSQNS